MISECYGFVVNGTDSEKYTVVQIIRTKSDDLYMLYNV